MRVLRRACLLLASAVVAIAFLGGSALAVMPVEVMDENAAGAHCPPVAHAAGDAEGGCHLFASSASVQLIQHRAGGDVVAGDCVWTFEVRVDENGEGWVENQAFTPGTTICGSTAVGGFTPCTAPPEMSGEEPLWHVNMEHDGEGNEVATLEFCIDDRVSPDVSCEWEGDLTLSISELPGHDLSAETLDTTGDPEESHWSIEHQLAHPVSGTSTCNFVRSLGEFEFRGHWGLRNEVGPSADVEIEHLF
jgi:hypothetical protein